MTLNIGAEICSTGTILSGFRARSTTMTDGGTGTCRPHKGGPQGKDTGRDERFNDLFHGSTLGFGDKIREAEVCRVT